MNRQLVKRILHTFLATALALSAGLAQADDTEIYFSTGSATGNIGQNNDPLRPNVLFILDTSGSMTGTVPGTSSSRITVLKDVMRDVINNVEDINLGLMRFTYNDGGPVLFPIHYVDDRASNVVSEPADTDPSFSHRIASSSDDAEELSDGTVNTGDSALEMVETPAVGGGTRTISLQVSASSDDAEQDPNRSGNGDMYLDSSDLDQYAWAGLRFQGVDIPQGATIDSASLSFIIRGKVNSNTDITFWGVDVDDTPTFGSGNNDISSRTRTSTSTFWNNVPRASQWATVTSPDIKTIVQEVVNRAGWASGNNMAFVMQQTNQSSNKGFYTEDKSSGQYAPRLTITYNTPAVAASSQKVAYHFRDIQIPQGATVSSANLVFVPSNSDSGATDLEFRAEAADDSAPLTSTSHNISSRPATTAVASWDSVPNWTSGSPVQTPDNINLNAVLQEVVNRSGWCGGNDITIIVSGSGLRRARSVDASESDAPQLNYTYQASSSNGCYNKTEGAQIASSRDDAEENLSNGDTTYSSSDLDLDNYLVGMRFQDINIPQGATILEAELTLTSDANDSGTASGTLQAEAADTTSQFTTSDDDISDRTLTSASVTWNHDDWSTNESYSSPDIKTVIQEVINRPGWVNGNSLVLVYTPTSGSREAYSNNGNAAEGPRLRIKYASTGGSDYKTVRQRLIEIVYDLNADGYTPIVEVMDEAARYWRGDKAKYGKVRDGVRTSRISHPGSYCNAANDCNGANTSGYPPYGVYTPSGCPGRDSNDSDCINESIQGDPNYISPFSSTLTCVSNYQVLLTDGEANSSGSTVQSNISSNYLGGAACLTSNGGGNSYDYDEKCGVDVAKALFENDQSTTLVNDQTVRTYTIAFNLNNDGASQFLMDMAALGNGESRVDFDENNPASWSEGFYSATSADTLYQAFADILLEVKRDPTSIASPSLATNAFNRLLSRDEVYFGLFTPGLETRWDGNIKKYKVCTDPVAQSCNLGEILDSTGGLAIDPVSNKFKDTSRSFWSDVVDGKATTKGGSGAEMSNYTDRVIYTDTTSTGAAPAANLALSESGHKITAANWSSTDLAPVRALVCPTPSTSTGSDCEDRMLQMLGKVITPNDETDITTTTRWGFNDVLHSSPAVATYGGLDTDSDGLVDVYYDRVLVGTNDGSLRFINGYTGKEEWSFIPEEVMSNQGQLFYNPEADHTYGLDTTPLVYIKDVDLNGIIEPAEGDLVYAYIGMRRGGSLLYALDLTASISSHSTSVVPKFLWRIEGGSGDFARMGQSWSKPELAKIKVNGVDTQVLIFGGGYDPALDSGFGTTPTSGNDNLGNAIYIVNATTGAKILSISGSSSGADIEVANMHFAIPSTLTVFDSDGNGYDDRIYATDTGGQIWRVDIGSNLNVSTPGTTVVGRLAALSTAGTAAAERRFFEPAAVVQVRDTTYSDAAGGNYDYVLAGSGYRAHPLDLAVQDRFYALRDKTTYTMVDSDGDNLADHYPKGTSDLTPLGHGDLIDLTSSTLDAADTTHKASDGWYFDLGTAEKVLAAPIVLAGDVYFTTYDPDATAVADLCSVNIGTGSVYAVSILDGSEAVDWTSNGTFGEDATDTDATDERKKVVGGGIPSAVVPIFTKQGVIGIVGTEGGAKKLDQVIELPQYRTYWYDE